jgi:HPt (histidine-containing phosphotransfer) domain-containing protein
MEYKTKIVDLTYLSEMSDNNVDLIKEMIDIFKEQVPEFITDMKNYFEKKEYFSLGLVAHKAKSSVYILGMKDLADMLKRFELLSKAEEEVDKYEGFINKFENQCNLAIEELNQLFD